ncbi:MAG: hypothetical protein ABIK07_09355, partial [Planctomycetota bacterium]
YLRPVISESSMRLVGFVFFVAMIVPVVLAVFYTYPPQGANSVPNSIEQENKCLFRLAKYLLWS